MGPDELGCVVGGRLRPISTQHDRYGKAVVRSADGEFSADADVVTVRFDSSGFTRIDGVVGTDVAVELESRVSKEVRGAILDLVLHPHPRKLLVLVPVHMGNPSLC